MMLDLGKIPPHSQHPRERTRSQRKSGSSSGRSGGGREASRDSCRRRKLCHSDR